MVRIDDSGKRTKCWLDYPDEIELLEEIARSSDWEREIAIQLMARIGCRASGVLTAKPSGLEWNSDGEYWQLEVRGKNTKGGEKTVRDTYIPLRVKENLERYASERGIDPDEIYVQASESTVRRWVREHSQEIAEETGNERWGEVSSHDLRRSWATHCLVEEGIPVRIMMAIGGWSSYEAIEPYLTKPTPGKIGEEMEEAGI